MIAILGENKREGNGFSFWLLNLREKSNNNNNNKTLFSKYLIRVESVFFFFHIIFPWFISKTQTDQTTYLSLPSPFLSFLSFPSPPLCHIITTSTQ
jgi:hypothetical protein